MKNSNKIIFALISVSVLSVAVYLLTKKKDAIITQEENLSEEEIAAKRCDSLEAKTCGTDHSLNFAVIGGDGSTEKVGKTCCEQKKLEWGSYDEVSKPSCLCP